MPLQTWLRAWLHTWLQAWLQGRQYMPTSLPTYIHTYIGCGRYMYIDVLCAPAGTTQRNGQQHQGTPYSSSHSRRYSRRYRSPCARLRIERARAKEAAAGVGKAAVRARALSLFSPPVCFTALLLATGYWLLATGYWLLATGYWLLATGCHSLQKYRNLLPRTARIAQDSPGPPGTAQLPSTCTTNSRKGQKVWRSDPDCLGVGAVKAAWGLPAADWAMPPVKASKVFS